jgi:hypothetical protein
MMTMFSLFDTSRNNITHYKSHPSPPFWRAFLFLESIRRKKNYLLSKIIFILILKGDFNMASRKFRFVSPGVFLKEIDNSQRPRTPEGVGPVIIGRTRKGPAMKPYKVRSMEEFERIFGKPQPGNQGEDPWRDGTGLLAEAYLPYAAKAYLSAEIDSPATIIRLAGVHDPSAAADSDGEPGWAAGNAWGIFLMPKNSNQVSASLELAAVFYGTTGADFGIKMKGKSETTADDAVITATASAVNPSSLSQFTVQLSSSAGTKDVTFGFEDIRKSFNTNPVMTNTNISSIVSGTLAHHYWLGETFEETYKRVASISGSANVVAVAHELADLMGDFKSTKHGLTSARTGWVFGNDTQNDSASYNPNDEQRLFRLLALVDGADAGKDLMISIEDIKPARTGSQNVFGTFSVVVKSISQSRLSEIERFDGCSLDPASPNYIARRIGDVYMEWDSVAKRNRVYGSNPNVSEFIRVEMNQEIEGQAGPIYKEQVPFGFYGPTVPKTQTVSIGATGGTASVGSFKALHNFTVSGGNGRTFRIKTVANTTGLVFTLDSSLASAAAASSNAAGQANEAAPKVGTSGISDNEDADFAAAIKAAIEGSTLASDLTVSAVVADSADSVLTITQNTKGAVTTIAHVSTADSNHFTITETNAGAAVDLLVKPSFSTWASTRAVSLSGTIATTSEVKLVFPSSPIVATGSLADSIAGGYTFGATPYTQTYVSSSGTPTRTINKGYVDFTRISSDHSTLIDAQETGLANTDAEISYKFTLDDVILVANPGIDATSISQTGHIKQTKHIPGSRKAGNSWSAKCTGSLEIRTLLDIVDGFHMPMVGGSDGVDITEADPFNMRVIAPGAIAATNYAYASVERAIDMIRDPEAIEHNLAAMPGITNTSLTTKLVRTCEARADSLAIIDLPGVYIPPFEEKCKSFKDRVDNTTPEKSAKDLVARQINSSYGATYYPWVKIKDEEFDRDVWTPPSVVALGVMAYTEERDDVWFAPAGFNRGGLNAGNAGLPVLQASEQLLSRDRDTLYAANINPVAQFVSEGLVIFGQKTLQADASALDRINVRRLLIFVKKEVSKISNNLLFEQNVQATWARFSNKVVPFLRSVKTRFGLSDFKVVLDETTTTPDLVDRNIMYAKVLLKPARSIEFIAVDFVITNTGASFED